MATKTIQKASSIRAFGDVRAPAPAPAPAPAEAPRSAGASGAIPFAKIDPTTFRLGPPIDGASDKHCKILTESGAPVRLTTGLLPSTTFAPFGAGPTKDKEGKILNPEWRCAFELEADDVAGLERFESWLKKETLPMSTTLLPGKGGKPTKYSEETLADKFNPFSRAGKDGHKALFTAAVQHVPFDAEGRPRRMPKIQKAIMDKEAGTITAPEPASPSEIVSGVACVAVFTASRSGAYYGQTGFGVKFTVESLLFFPNIMKNAAPAIDITGMTIVPGSCGDEDRNEPPGAPVAPGGEVVGADEAQQFSDGGGSGSPGATTGTA